MGGKVMELGIITQEGAFVIPAPLRERFGLTPGTSVIAEERDEGILIRPSSERPVRLYTKEEIAEFLLNNSVGEQDYLENREEVRKLGLDPDKITHLAPSDR